MRGIALPMNDTSRVEPPRGGLSETIRLAQAGDESSFEALMAATQRRVASLAYRMLGSADEARDATQEVYLRVYRFLGRFRAGEDFHAWLYRITINVCHDLRRKRRPAAPLPGSGRGEARTHSVRRERRDTELVL